MNATRDEVVTHMAFFLPGDGDPVEFIGLVSASGGSLISDLAGDPDRAGGTVKLLPLPQPFSVTLTVGTPDKETS